MDAANDNSFDKLRAQMLLSSNTEENQSHAGKQASTAPD